MKLNVRDFLRIDCGQGTAVIDRSLATCSLRSCVFVVSVLVFIACRPSTAAEYVLINNEFGIIRDFAKIELSDAEAKNARIFVDIEKIGRANASASENAELQKIALDALGARFRLVAKEDDANYSLQIRMEEYVDYALRNPRREPAQGFVMASICRYPITEMDSDCGNYQYFFFTKERGPKYSGDSSVCGCRLLLKATSIE